MNPSDNKNFIDLAMKEITRQSTEQERSELAELLEYQPELRDEHEQLRADADILREVGPLVEAVEATSGELPGYVRERLRQHFRQTIGYNKEAATAERTHPSVFGQRRLRWAAAFAGVFMVMGFGLLVLRQNAFFMSWLDRGEPSSQNINGEFPIGMRQFEFQAAFITNVPVTPEVETKERQDVKFTFYSDVRTFSNADDPELKAWEADAPSSPGRTVVQPTPKNPVPVVKNPVPKAQTPKSAKPMPRSRERAVVKLIYDRAGERVRVIGWYHGTSFENTFKVEGHDLHKAFMEAQRYVYHRVTILQTK